MSDGYLNNPLLKKANEKVSFTKEQIREFSKCKKDVIYFAENYMKVVNLDLGEITIPLYDYQKELLRILNEETRIAGIQSRQSGKTTTITVDILHYILFNEHKTVAILANKGDTAQEIMSRVQFAYERLPKWLQAGVSEWNKKSFKLDNGCKVIAAASSSSSVRGRSISYLLVDETSFVQNWDEFYSSVYSTVASSKEAKIVFISTANGLNHYYKIISDARSQRSTFKVFEVTWRDVPGRDEKWRLETIANTSIEQFNQEHENQFMGSSNSLISSAKLSDIPIQDAVETQLNNTLCIYKQPDPTHTYFMSVDTSRGKGLDNSAFLVIDVTTYPFEVVCSYYDSDISPLMYPNIINAVGVKYNNAHCLVEINDIGEQIANQLNYDLEYENLIFSKNNKKYTMGVRTTKSVKSIGCSTMRQLVENDKIIINDGKLINELSGFIQKGASFEADTGYHDDLVMCLVLFSWYTTQPMFDNIKTDFNLARAINGDSGNDLMETLMPGIIAIDGVNNTYETISESAMSEDIREMLS